VLVIGVTIDTRRS